MTNPYLIMGIVAFVVFDALVVVTVFSLGDLQRHVRDAEAIRGQLAAVETSSERYRGDGARTQKQAQERYDALVRQHNEQVRRIRDLRSRVPWRWSAAIFRLKVPDAIPESASPTASQPPFEALLNQLVPRLGLPLMAYMLTTGPGAASDPRVVLRWAAGKDTPLGLAIDRRVRTIHAVVDVLSNHLRDRQIRRWFGEENTRANNLTPAEAVRRDYLAAVLQAADAEVADR